LKVLISGAGSGLGKFLHTHFDAVAFDRTKDSDRYQVSEPWDAIIHCAFNGERDVSLSKIADYFDDNVGLTETLLALPHKRFVFLSTTDVYSSAGGPFGEEEGIDSDTVIGIYAVSKLLAESRVLGRANKPLILRPTTLLGKDARPSNLLRLLNDDAPKLSVTGSSRYNVVLHTDICRFIEIAISGGVIGPFNLASNTSSTVEEIASALHKEPQFGDHLYSVRGVSNAAAVRVCPSLNKSSIDACKEFLREN